MELPTKMKVARMHVVGAPLILEELDTPQPGENDVLVRVRSCGIVPNLGNILANWSTWFPDLPLPPLPAIFGLDPAGEVVAVGSNICSAGVGDRVYVNPGRYCGSCNHCSRGDVVACRHYTFNGYFGFSDKSERMFRKYPHAGLGEYMTAPAACLVTIPDNMSFDQAARLGYIGTAYSGLRKANIGPASTILIQGASGTLGLGGVISALAMGVKRILGTGRNRAQLAAMKAIAPDRIETFCLDDGSVATWAKSMTDGEGVDATLDCLGTGAEHDIFLEGLYSLRRGGRIVNVGAVAGKVPVDFHYMMDRNIQMIGSLWFTPEEGRELAAFAQANLLNMAIFEHQKFALADVNQAISGIAARNGGFSNFVIHP